ncbi:phosphate/phosphite/phosphonate ABC transporter substrate-binding protein [Azotobacter chroococcum]|uniref:Phosphonate transport system substrate-binding protein n=1 Tax=Azotobacter beijerinckii TaxID=170623 RepID=A0A1I1BCG9_9GAMM|nr:phosphate/phosphite/phosphonate ABC transporter substrate-binding protein [Azotobacter beijerinckii]MEE4461924.1 phosphate/phosphite/phosphonate ABC transporter substrate-binding protein [Azotobacter chroococcum]SFB48054.1 phosphonate transport system substrate-binding protein [Azotobacter beijerinckii]
MKALRCGLLPGESRAVVERLNDPLRARLERCLGLPVKLVVGSTYVATGEALRRGQLDLAYLGPVTYILQSRHAGLEPFARPTHGGSRGPTFQAAIIVPADSAVESLGQLRGAEIAMGDLASTSGAWVPRHMLLTAGLSADRDYVRRTLGAHDQVAAAVAAGRSPAGGLSLPILRRLLAEGQLNHQAVRILAESPPIPEYVWTFREGLPAELREAVRRAFIELHEPAVLDAYAAEAFIPTVDADVDRVRHWMEEILGARLQPGGLVAAGGRTVPAARRLTLSRRTREMPGRRL